MIIPSYWVHTVTIFHKTTDSNGMITWSRQVVNKCFWNDTTSEYRGNGHADKSGRVVVRIPVCSVTIQTGDIAVKGNVTELIDEYTSGSRSTDVIKKYTGKCFTITGLHDNSDVERVLPHIMIEGALG